MSNVRGRNDAQHGLEESEQWLREQIESLRAMNEESKVVLQRIVERQSLVIEAMHGIADKHQAFARRIPRTPPCDVVSPGGSEPVVRRISRTPPCDVVSPGGPELVAGRISRTPPCDVVSPGGSAQVAVVEALESEFAAAELGVQPAGAQRATSPGSLSRVLSVSLRNRRDSFVQNVATRALRRQPTLQELGCLRWARLTAGRVLRSWLFDYFIALCVLANAVAIGVEIDQELLGRDTQAVAMLEYVFVSIYIVEMGMHFVADGPGCLRNGWVLFDFFLVVVGSISILFGDKLITFLEQSGASGDVTKGASPVLVLRLVRLLRLARAFRLIAIFESLWKLVIGLFHALKTMASTVVLMTITVFIFACLGVELITKDETLREDEVAAGLIAERFASVPGIMLTLVQFATMDSIASIYYPLIMLRSWLVAYFMVLLLILSIAVMNLVTALIVEDALASTAQDAEAQALSRRKQLKKIVPIITDLFRALDRSGDGRIQIEEIVEVINSKQVEIPMEIRDIVSMDRILDLFEFLDLDGSGELDENEFVDGMCHLAITSVPVETTQILQLLRQQRRDIGLLHCGVHRLERCTGSKQSSCPEIGI